MSYHEPRYPFMKKPTRRHHLTIEIEADTARDLFQELNGVVELVARGDRGTRTTGLTYSSTFSHNENKKMDAEIFRAAMVDYLTD